MTKNELKDLIDASFSESFKSNEAFLKENFSMIASTIPFQSEKQLSDFCEAMFNYTTSISKLSCYSVFKTLSSIGVLDIEPSND